MSGIFPGTRTQIFQRLRVLPLHEPGDKPQWARLLWYAEPAACVVYLPSKAEQDANAGIGGDVLSAPVSLTITEPLAGDFNAQLQATLRQAQWQMQSCGSCQFWQAGHGASEEQLPLGRCAWQTAVVSSASGASLQVPTVLATQANLALPCTHWQPAAAQGPSNEPIAARQSIAPMRKAAEISESKLPYWTRRWQQWRRWGQASRLPASWEEKLVERSGVGAGTEPCFVCQGRIANLGALAVETPEGDKQTFSIWRCRACYTTYLNNWIDRWERLESLETEETYYRLAPAEALVMLERIALVPGGDHPGRRRERSAEREFFLQFIAPRKPLSHQIRQGR